MNPNDMLNQLEQAASRALLHSEEMRQIVHGWQELGYDITAKLDITVQRCAPVPSLEVLEALYRLPDRRQP